MSPSLCAPQHLPGTRASQALVQPADVYATLKDWSQGDSTPWPSDPFAGRSMFQLLPPQDWIRDVALVRSNPTQMAISTPAWFLRVSVAGDEHKKHEFVSDHQHFGNRFRLELFAKPDDYFEVNDVSNRCLDVIDEFQQISSVSSAVSSLALLRNSSLPRRSPSTTNEVK